MPTLLNSQTWTIIPIVGYNTIIVFHRMKMLYSQNCDINSLTLIRRSPCEHAETYCGHLPPWNESYPSVTMNITVKISSVEYKTDIKLSYFISKSISMTVIKNIFLTDILTMSSLKDDSTTVYLQQNVGIKQKISLFIYSQHYQLIHISVTNISHQGMNAAISSKYISDALYIQSFICWEPELRWPLSDHPRHEIRPTSLLLAVLAFWSMVDFGGILH